MPRPFPSARRRRATAPQTSGPKRPPPWFALGVALAFFLVALGIGTAITLRDRERDRPARLLAEAEAAVAQQDWPLAFAKFHDLNATDARSARNLLVEAQFALATDQGRLAAAAAHAADRLDPRVPDATLVLLNRLRTLDRPDEALALGLGALPRLDSARSRVAVLAATTAATLAEVPDTEARPQLDRWIAADPADTDAQVARLNRISAVPHRGDPDRAARIAQLQALVDRHPEHAAARAALVAALADAGEVDRGRSLLDAWPEPRDARYSRLRARWDLDHDHQPARAVEGFRLALRATPHDWRLHYGLARALRTLGQVDAAEREALAVARLRERLDPSTAGPSPHRRPRPGPRHGQAGREPGDDRPGHPCPRRGPDGPGRRLVAPGRAAPSPASSAVRPLISPIAEVPRCPPPNHPHPLPPNPHTPQAQPPHRLNHVAAAGGGA